MDRQLTVWAAPGLVLLVALIALLSGHLPKGLIPQSAPRHVPAAPAAAAEPKASSGGGGSLSDVVLPPAGSGAGQAEKPAQPGKPTGGAKPSGGAGAGARKPSAPVAYDGPAGIVAGRIVYDGAPPAPGALVSVSVDDLAKCCADTMDRGDRTLRVAGSGGVADVVVMIKAAGAEASGAGTEVVMDQKCCRFEPHVLIVPQGADVRYENSDEFNHNVHMYAKKNKSINSNLAGKTSTVVPLKSDEVFAIGCDIHPWMKAQVFVTEFATTAVTDADGNFKIEGVPPGEWTVELWSETLKKGKQKVAVQPDSTTTVEWKIAKGK